VYPDKNNIKSIIILDPNDNKVELHKADSIDEIKELIGEYQTIEWESIPETDIAITKPSDIDSLGDK
jgi:hypothetical protein